MLITTFSTPFFNIDSQQMVETSVYLIQFDAAASVALSLLGDLLFFLNFTS